VGNGFNSPFEYEEGDLFSDINHLVPVFNNANRDDFRNIFFEEPHDTIETEDGEFIERPNLDYFAIDYYWKFYEHLYAFMTCFTEYIYRVQKNGVRKFWGKLNKRDNELQHIYLHSVLVDAKFRKEGIDQFIVDVKRYRLSMTEESRLLEEYRDKMVRSHEIQDFANAVQRGCSFYYEYIDYHSYMSRVGESDDEPASDDDLNNHYRTDEYGSWIEDRIDYFFRPLWFKALHKMVVDQTAAGKIMPAEFVEMYRDFFNTGNFADLEYYPGGDDDD